MRSVVVSYEVGQSVVVAGLPHHGDDYPTNPSGAKGRSRGESCLFFRSPTYYGGDGGGGGGGAV